jgi:hypothetical protein
VTKPVNEQPLLFGSGFMNIRLTALRPIIYKTEIKTRKNCFRYLKLMSPLNATICTTTYLERQKCYGPGKKILLKKQLFDLEVKGQGPTKVIMVHDTPPYGHAPTYQISFTYLERQPEALKSLYRSPGYKKNQLVLCKNYVLQW